MKIRAIHACMAALFFLTGPLYAQDQPPSEQHQPPSADKIISKMQSTLNLTQDQVAAITPIIEKYTSQREALKQQVDDGTIEKSDMHSQMKDLKASETQDLSQVLSPDQMNQWEQMHSHKHQNNSAGNVSGPSGSSGDSSTPPPSPPQE